MNTRAHVLRWAVGAMIGASAISGCTSRPVQQFASLFQSKDKPQLATGIRLYEQGKYQQATTTLQDALNGGLTDAEQITANKYLAFISCASARERQCRAYFKRALELDPAFELEPSEASNPAWAPVFKSVKTRR